MSFFRIQRIITLAARLSFFLFLSLSFYCIALPSPFPLSRAGSAALYALLITLPLGHASSFWFMTVSNLTFVSVLYAAADLLIRRTEWHPAWRRLTLEGWLPFVICGIYLLAGLIVAKKIRKKRYPIRTSHPLPQSRLRIVHLADVHPSPLQTEREVVHIFEMIDSENPDVVVLTGDIFDENTTHTAFRRYLQLFAALHPKYGIYFVYGNHDANSHWKKPSHTREDIEREFAAVGITILEDEAAVIANGAVRITGRRDLEEGERMTAAELYGSLPKFSGLELLLCHEPVELAECAAAGAELILAGHTHGGQIFPVGIITNHLLKLNDANAGRLLLPNGASAIITSGVGTWSYPIRTESRSEIVVVDVYTE